MAIPNSAEALLRIAQSACQHGRTYMSLKDHMLRCYHCDAVINGNDPTKRVDIKANLREEQARHRAAVGAIQAGAADDMPPLHQECVALMIKGIVPQWAVKLARHLGDSAMLARTFPSLNLSERYTLMQGSHVIGLTQKGWIVKVKE